ncbi:hypothetical protein PAECIP111802_03224 [Paenibacillus allorhizosphaerae]|uniref:Uncharacterized protein n=1 Tax=Paenibacillus allorhizosphaerae TaxID=2849866 RepID=A0ABM8VIN6_9BACL|nr:hypothetical protein PAECIP111802_03224 [Paenibacillus allorhizosphaerae]
MVPMPPNIFKKDGKSHISINSAIKAIDTLRVQPQQ